MSKINKVKVDNVIYDIEDASVPSWARENKKPIYKYEELENLPVIPSKTSELENDAYFIKSTENAYFTNGVRMYNHNTQSDGRKVDLLVEHIQGVGYGGYEDDLYLNHKSSNDVRVLENGAGTFYYKGKEVADREYVDEQISNIETGEGGITEIPIASATTLGGIKVGANLIIDENGVLSATSGSGSNLDVYSTEEQIVGTYFDKTLYKKTYTGIIQYEYAGTYYTLIKLDNGEKFERVIDYKGFLSDTTNEVGNLYDIHIDGVFPIKLTNGNVDFRTPQMFYKKYFEITLYYTKTTI